MRKHQLICSLAAGVALAGVRTVHAEDAATAKSIKLPFVVYDEKGSANNHYIASGWMGNTKGIAMDDACTTNAHAGNTCLRVEYSEAGEWAGIVWQDPANDWGDQDGGWNLDRREETHVLGAR